MPQFASWKHDTPQVEWADGLAENRTHDVSIDTDSSVINVHGDRLALFFSCRSFLKKFSQ